MAERNAHLQRLRQLLHPAGELNIAEIRSICVQIKNKTKSPETAAAIHELRGELKTSDRVRLKYIRSHCQAIKQYTEGRLPPHCVHIPNAPLIPTVPHKFNFLKPYKYQYVWKYGVHACAPTLSPDGKILATLFVWRLDQNEWEKNPFLLQSAKTQLCWYELTLFELENNGGTVKFVNRRTITFHKSFTKSEVDRLVYLQNRVMGFSPDMAYLMLFMTDPSRDEIRSDGTNHILHPRSILFIDLQTHKPQKIVLYSDAYDVDDASILTWSKDFTEAVVIPKSTDKFGKSNDIVNPCLTFISHFHKNKDDGLWAHRGLDQNNVGECDTNDKKIIAVGPNMQDNTGNSFCVILFHTKSLNLEDSVLRFMNIPSGSRRLSMRHCKKTVSAWLPMMSTLGCQIEDSQDGGGTTIQWIYRNVEQDTNLLKTEKKSTVSLDIYNYVFMHREEKTPMCADNGSSVVGAWVMQGAIKVKRFTNAKTADLDASVEMGKGRPVKIQALSIRADGSVVMLVATEGVYYLWVLRN